jgi:hypothetical protein
VKRPESGTVAAWAVIAAMALVLSAVRWRAADLFHKLKVTSDVYPLVAPEQLVVASLGYRSAFADALFASTLVSYGLHFQEKHRFEFVGEYLDAMNALDPTFRDPYQFADTMLIFEPEPPRIQDYLRARDVLRRGLQNRPTDTELFHQVGSYLAYTAAPWLPTELAKEFRLEGAKVLARACELASNDENVQYGCMTSARLFDKAGERDAAIESMKRLLAVTDDPEIERRALGFMRVKQGESEEERQKLRKDVFRRDWKKDLPFISKNAMLVVGPAVDVAYCAGAAHADDAVCAATWREWARHVDPDRD